MKSILYIEPNTELARVKFAEIMSASHSKIVKVYNDKMQVILDNDTEITVASVSYDINKFKHLAFDEVHIHEIVKTKELTSILASLKK